MILEFYKKNSQIMIRKLKKVFLLKNKETQYLKWMALNSYTSSINSALSTHVMLEAISPTNNNAITNMTINYLGKDIIGQIGSLVYAWKTGHKADQHPKKHIVKGSVMQNMGIWLENGSQFAVNTPFLLPILGISNIAKNIGWISVGAVNANNLQRIASTHIGALYSKVSTVNTLTSTFGLATGLIILQLIPSYTIRNLTITPIITVINIYSLKKATEIAQS